MFISVSHGSPHRRHLAAAAADASRVLELASGVPTENCHRQQTRSFRFGSWMANLDPELRNELLQRQKLLRHKYMEMLKRQQTSDRYLSHRFTKFALGQTLLKFWIAASPANTGGYASPGKQPGHFSTGNFAKKRGWAGSGLDSSFGWGWFYQYDTCKTPSQNLRDARNSTMDQCAGEAKNMALSYKPHNPKPTESASERAADYFIDPITNRKVPNPRPRAADFVPSKSSIDPSQSSVKANPGTSGRLLSSEHTHEPTTAVYDDLQHKCGPERSNEPDSQPERENKVLESDDPTAQTAEQDNRGSDAIMSAPAKASSYENHKTFLEGDKSSSEAAWDAQATETLSDLKQSRPRADCPKHGDSAKQAARLTGNYVRDFPEEFSGPWAGIEGYAPGDLDDGMASNTAQKLEPAISRLPDSRHSQIKQPPGPVTVLSESNPPTRKPEIPATLGSLPLEDGAPTSDTMSTEPVNAEGNHNGKDAALADPLRQIYEQSYGKIEYPVFPPSSDPLPEPRASRTLASENSAEGPRQPTLYKILAYDSTMQTINTAEATSIVPDTATPLTPAEVLVRLSSPAKFFPHFGPLQAQGFEIVSGSGDVLVFRKVRDVSASVKPRGVGPRRATMGETATRLAPKAQVPPVNPIDMMGSQPILPNIGNFASPTGFVNYDVPGSEVTRKPPPPFRSGIDDPHEEPVYSGTRTTVAQPRRPGLMKRVVTGAAVVAGASYAVGVVSDYF